MNTNNTPTMDMKNIPPGLDISNRNEVTKPKTNPSAPVTPRVENISLMRLQMFIIRSVIVPAYLIVLLIPFLSSCIAPNIRDGDIKQNVSVGEIEISGEYYPRAIYKEPDFSSELLLRASPGDRLKVIREIGSWYEVVTGEGIGYLHVRDSATDLIYKSDLLDEILKLPKIASLSSSGVFGSTPCKYAKEDCLSLLVSAGTEMSPPIPGRLFGGIKLSKAITAPASASALFLFPSRHVDDVTRDRHLMFCRAFMAQIPPVGSLRAEGDIPLDSIMVTTWPVTSTEIEFIREVTVDDVCEAAVEKYDYTMSKIELQKITIIKDKYVILGEPPSLSATKGPFLVGSRKAPVGVVNPSLIIDMSNIETLSQAKEAIGLWTHKLSVNPAYWDDGWNIEKLKLAIKIYVENTGDRLISYLFQPETK